MPAHKKQKVAPKKEDKKEKKELQFVEPFAPGLFIMCRWSVDNTIRNAEVIENQECKDKDGKRAWKYYVHYTDFNRRMDEWIDSDRVTGQGVKVDPHAHQHDEDNNDDRDELTIAPQGHGGSGSLSATIHVHKEKDKKKKQVDSEFTEAEHEEHEGMDEASLREHEEVTKIKNINRVCLGKFEMDAWYFSPFPKEYYPDGPIEILYFCEFTLKFFRHQSELERFKKRKNPPRHPPGNEIYRGKHPQGHFVSMFEINPVDSEQAHQYAQNLCYIAKLFLDHKTLYYDVDPFIFYVLCELDDRGFHPVGYYSKEKYSDMGYNLACILTFPCYQRKGYGRMLIEFSYALSKLEEKVGSPEKPLSDLGAVSYRSYWSSVLLEILKDHSTSQISVQELGQMTSINPEDIKTTLQYLGLVKYWNGSHIISVPQSVIESNQKKLERVKQGPQVQPELLHWTPYLIDVKGEKKDKWSLKSKKNFNSDELPCL